MAILRKMLSCNARIAGSALLALCCAMLFFQSLDHELLRWDDAMHLLENPHLYQPWSWAKLRDIWSQPYFGLYIPMTYTIWGFLKLATTSPAAFHALNIFFHVGNVLLVYHLLTCLRFKPLASILGAGIFMAHPLCVEPIAWISGFKDVGSTFWGLSAVSFFVAQKLRRGVRYPAALLCYFLSVMSKPSGVVFGVIAAILAIIVRKTDDPVSDAKGNKASKIRLREWLRTPSFHAWIGVIVASPAIFISMYLQPLTQMQEVVIWWKRPVIALDAIAFYVQKIVFPWSLLPDYAHTPSVVLAGEWWWASIFGLAFTFASLIMLRMSLRIALGLVIVIVALAPNLGLIPFAFQDHSTVADRYAYAALFGVALVVAQLSTHRWMAFIFMASLPILSFKSYQQTGLWKDQKTLFQYVLKANPQSFVALDGLGVDAYRKGELVHAEEFFRRALAVNPRSAKGWFNLGSVLWVRGEVGVAVESLETSLKLDPNNPDTLNNLGFAYASTSKEEAAESLYRRALLVNNLDLDARFNLSRLLAKRGAYAESDDLLKGAMIINPGFAEKYLKVHH
jgi:hypothetical protein